MHLAPSCIFAFNSNIDLVAYPKLSEVEKFFRRRISSGGEILIDARMAKCVAASFKWEEIRLGGQAGNMANAAAALGVKCLAHSYNLSSRQKGLFAKGVEVVGEKTGKESVHYILELKLRSGKRDRLIATHDPANSNLLTSPKFASRSLEFIADGCNRAMVGGFHLLRPGNSKQRIAAAAKLLLKWKAANQNLRIHLEAGEFSGRKTLSETIRTILPLVDSVGVNEMEVRSFGGFKKLAKLVPEVVVHTSSCASATSRIRSKEALSRALSFGHSLAAYRALTGKYAKLSNALRLMKKVPKPEFGKDCVSVPSLRIRPRFTVGLGDSFAAGYFLVG